MEVEKVPVPVQVQAMASALAGAPDAMPPEFVQPEQDRPGSTTFRGAAPEVPVVDISGPEGGRAAAAASREWGIFQVVNHGIPAEVIAELQRVGREFFELPQAEKARYAMDPNSGRFEGYGTNLRKNPDGKKDWVDFFFHVVWPPSSVDYSIWPTNPPDYRKAYEEYTKHLVRLMDKIFEYLSVGLGLEKHVLKEACGGEELKLLAKINYYPLCPRPDLALGVPPHTDLSTLTLLVPNDVPGLQVFRDGHWFDADYVPNAVIVHIGDQIEILSNGKYKSVLHRTTVNKEKVRISWPVFCEPPGDLAIGPLPQLVGDDNPAKYKTKKFKDYKHCKINKLPQ